MSNADILWHHSQTQETQIWFMNGSRVASRATVLDESGHPIFVGPPWSIVGVGDFNGDANADVVWHNSQTQETQIWFMKGEKIVSRATALGETGKPTFIGPPFMIVGVGNFNADGNSDILWHHSQTQETQIWFMNGPRVAGRATVLDETGQPLFVGPPWSIVGVADFNHDGHADILWHNAQTQETQIWFMSGGRVASRATVLGETGQPAFVGPPWNIVGVGDFNNDGNADILWHNSQTQETQIWFMSGGRVVSRATVLGETGQPTFIEPPFTIVGVGEFNPVGREYHGGRLCDFLDNAGSPTIGIRGYGLKSGHPRASRLTFSASGVINGVGLAPTVQTAFARWAAATVSQPGRSPMLQVTPAQSGPGDIAVGVGPLNASVAGSTKADGTAITISSTFPFSQQNPAAPKTCSLLAVMIHEVGHALGLLHSTNPSSVMNPANCSTETLADEDIAAINALYGWQGQTPIPNIGTDESPALCTCGNSLVMAWKGINETNIWVSRSNDGLRWTPQTRVFGAASTDGPSLAWDGRTLWMAFRGIADDDGLYWTTCTDTSENFGQAFGPVLPVPNTGSANAPGITIFNGTPFLVWRGIDGDDGLYYSTFGQGAWSGQRSIGGVGSRDRPSVCVDFNGIPRMIWRGVDGDDGLYSSALVNIFWQPQDPVRWIVAGNGPAGSVGIGFAGSDLGASVAMDMSGSPSFTVGSGIPGNIFLVWRGVAGDSGIYFTQGAPAVTGGPPVEWSTQAVVSGIATSHRPAIALLEGRIHLVWKGSGEDHTIWTTSL